MRIETFLKQSPMFCVGLAARRFDALTARILDADGLNFLEALILATLFFESPAVVKPSQLAETFGTTRGNVSHCISSLEAKGLVQRKIDPEDARAYHLALRPPGRKTAIRVIGALDKVQREFENEVGRDTLQSALLVIRSLGDAALNRVIGEEN
ncbi:MarR family winged helix-turn-helix transcriptional regulator [Paracidobacterium acidisoli]|uniref:MarR family transcriptional regulator n=1 Tax=Paracidobacterium acidisoli TaxID=2303751 RepID=A0A372IM39_9BACT|nr:MarR family transcriptional regulator [Paracidobacterium acidisoli]MBT9332417.1 MarR family transcriptional regulator [Paracidobacterium acidisoli]